MSQPAEHPEQNETPEPAHKADAPIRIEKDAIAALPLGQWEGKIVMVEHPEDVAPAVAKLMKERVLGFDTETKPNFKPGGNNFPSLVQLAGKDTVYLFRLDDCGGIPGLFPIFRDAKILKVGVAVKDDVKNLKDRAPFRDAGFVEISDFTRKANIENTGLRALVAHYLGMRISKGAQVTNWAAKHLTPVQVTYAATDAWVSRELYVKLEDLGVIPHKGGKHA
jgi:ribonuclease D